MNLNTSIVVTGTSVVAPLGIGNVEFWNGLISGRSAISPDPRLSDIDVPWKNTARIDDFDGKKFVKPRKALKVMCREIQFGYVAATLAVEQATQKSLPEHDFHPDQTGCVFGAEMFQGEPEELISSFIQCRARGAVDTIGWGQVAFSQIQPLWMLKYLPNMAASHVSIALDSRGPNNTICQGDVSSALAIIEGADLIRRGWADACIVGGTSSRISPTSMVYRGPHDLSPDHLLPFAANRNGTVHGEGAGAMVLESRTAAESRGRKILATLRGWACGFSRFRADEFPKAIQTIASQALQRANLDWNDLGHVNANGTGGRLADEFEASAIQSSAPTTPVLAIKSRIGQLGPSSGVVETIGSLLALERKTLPACSSPNTPSLVNLTKSIHPIDHLSFLKISFSNQGQIAALVFSAE